VTKIIIMGNSTNLLRLRNLALVAMVFFFNGLFAQLSGVKTIPGNYATIAAAVTDLNINGVGTGGVTFNVAAGYTESTTAEIAITATGTSANPIVFQKSGAGANPIITRTDAGILTTIAIGAQGDAVVSMNGTDYITFNGINVTATNSGVEYGYLTNKPSATDGCQNVTITNSVVTMTKGTSAFVVGIYVSNGSTSVASATGVTVTAASGTNANINISGNTVQNVHAGIMVRGSSATGFYDDGIVIGQSGAGNIIQNFGGGNASSTYGIYFIYVNNANADYNTINNAGSGGIAHTATLYGIFYSVVTGNISGNNNAFTIANSSTSASYGVNNTNAVNVETFNNNTFASGALTSTGAVYLIYASDAATSKTISGNSISGTFTRTSTGTTYCYYNLGAPLVGSTETVTNNNFSNFSASTTGSIYGIYSSTTNGTKVCSGNTISNWNAGTTGIRYCYYFLGGNTNTVTNNTLSSMTFGSTAYCFYHSGTTFSSSNNAISNITISGTGTFYGYYSYGTNNTFANNTITGITSTGTGTMYGLYVYGTVSNMNSCSFTGITHAGTVYGMYLSASGTTSNVSGCNLYNITSSGATVMGIYAGAVTNNIAKNKIANIKSTSASAVVSGLTIASNGGTFTNNIIGDLNATAATGTALAPAVRAINITSATANKDINLYHNSIYLNATSTGANFSTAGIFATQNATATTARLLMMGNIVVNLSTPTGTGIASTYTRSAIGNNNYNNTSNFNVFYAGTPAANKLLFYDGTNSLQAMAAYQAFVVAEPASYSFAPTFLSTTSSASNYLHIDPTVATLLESGSTTSIGVTVDYDNDVRFGGTGYAGTGSNPDIGADEFSGIALAPQVALVSVTPPVAPALCTAAPRVITVNIGTTAGTVTGANLAYTVNGVAQAPIAMTNTSGSTWTATIPVPSPVNATIAWVISAANSGGYNGFFTGTPYSDEPLFGATALATVNASSICTGASAVLQAVINQTPAVYAAPTISSPLSDEDFGAITISSGSTVLLNNVTTQHSLVGTIGTATGTPGGYSDFSALATVSLSAGSTYNFSLSSITSATNYSNSVAMFIDYNRDGDFLDAGEMVYQPTATTSGPHTESGTFTVPVSAFGVTRMRVVALETLITSYATTSSWGEYEDYTVSIAQTINWFASSTQVGTGSPFNVTPPTTTTYNATVFAGGCSLVSNDVTVTTLVLPTAPAATNSAQCGTNTPLAAVASTAGTAGSGQFYWYNAATNGTIVQNPPVSSTYTTFYSNNFSNLTIGTGATLTGVANLTGVLGQLQLTPNALSQQGGIMVSPGVNAQKYKVDFDMATSLAGADGLSYSFGNDVNTASTTPAAEMGSGSKLKVSFDAYGVMPNAAGIYILYNNTAASFNDLTPGVLGYVNNTSWIASGSNHVTIETNELGQLTLSLNGTALFTNVQLPAAYVSANKSTWSHAIAARTGGVSMEQTIDNLVIQTAGFAAGSTTFQNPISTTTTYYVSELGTNGCYSPTTPLVATVISPDPLVITSGLTPAICLGQPFTTTVSSIASPAYTYSWDIPTYTGSGISAPVTQATLATTPTVAGVYPYTITGTNGVCTAVVTVNLTVNALPVITTATASPAVACHNSNVTLAASSIVSGPQTEPVGYCASNATSTFDEEILGVTLGSMTNSSTCATTGGAGSIQNQYSNFTTLVPALNVQPGSVYPLTVQIGTCNGNYNNFTKVFIDWNRDGDFLDASETAYQSATFTNGPHLENGSITVPAFAQMGITRMRVVNVETTVATSVNSCGTYTWGETEDYWLNIQSSPAIPYSYVWNTTPAINAITGTVVASNTTSAQTTQSWSITATEAATGCTNTMSTAAITIQPAFLAPTATNSTHCGTQIPTASLVDPNAFTSPTFNWYASAALGTALQSTSANTYGSIVGTTTTLYATVSNPATGCQSDATPVLVTVIAPPALSLSTNALTTCDGVASSNATLTGASAYNNFTWSPAAGVNGSTATGYNFTSSASGVYTLTAVQTSGQLCATTATLALTVNPNPVITSSTASPVNICNGGTVTVVASSTLSGPQTEPTGYCTSNATSTADEEILNVSIATLNNSSTCATTGGAGSIQSEYSNFTTTVAPVNLMLGSIYPMTVTIGTCGGNYSNFTKVFIDFNRDGDFLDANETAYLSPASTVGPHIEAALISIPTSAQLGITRMRVVNVETSVATSVNSCGTYTWGETEDYLVNLQSPPPAVYTYVWNTIPAVSSISGTTTAINTTANDVIEARIVTATNPATSCFTNMSSNNFTIHPTPVINAGQDVLICSNNATEQTTLTAVGAGVSGTYAWTGPVSGVVNATPFTVGASGTYSVVGTTQWGCFSSDTLSLTYSTIPVAGAGVDQAICLGQTATFTANGLAPFTWTTATYPGSGISAPTVGGTLSVTPTISGTYTYNVGVANSVGCTNDDQVQLTVWALPVVNAGVDQTICNASPAILSGSGALTYTWTNNVTNATPFFPSSTANYTVDGVDIHGCHNFDNVNVNVLPQPIVNAGIDQTVCATTPVILFAQTTANTPTAVTGFQWNNSVVNATQFTPTATATYTVTATGANGCTNQDQVVVTVLALPTVNAGNDITVCAGLSATLNATGAATYSWNNGVTQAIPFYPNATTSYTVTGTGANGCTNQDQVVVTVSTGPTVTVTGNQVVCANSPATLSAASTNSMGGFWTTSNGLGTISPNISNGTVTYVPTANDPVVVNLTYVASNACGNASQSTTLTVLPSPTVNAGPDIASCAGLPVTLSATSNGFITWNNNVSNNVAFVPGSTATYTVTAVGANNCTNTDQMVLTVLALPDVNAGADQTICSGSTATLNGSGANTYLWNNGVVNSVAFAPTATQTYTVTGTALNGCQASDQVVVTVNATPVALVSVVNDVTVAASPAGMNYQWINCASGTDIPTATTAQFTATANGSYAVIVTSLQGCEDVSDCITISSVGLDQINISDMNVFPNPTNGEVNVSMPENMNADVQIFDAQGKLVAEQLNVTNNGKLNISNVTPGVYMVRLTAENAVQTFRVVKN
jgi:hypothetical protein